MSHTAEWNNKLENYRYSQDERSLAYKFSQNLNKKVDAFLSDNAAKTLSLGTFNFSKNKWYWISISDLKKHGIKIMQKKITDDETEIVLQKLALGTTQVR